MKKTFAKISACFVAALLLVAAAGCSFFAQPNKERLATPAVTVNSKGVASWDAVEHASSYVYVIDEGKEQSTDALRVQLAANESVKVKAVSGSAQYSDSEFSPYKKYTVNVRPPEGHVHTDADKDGVCDGCSSSVMAELSFYAVNDLHGKFMDTDSQPGLDEFTTYIKGMYADTEREEILLSSGDMWQGTVESSGTKGKLMTEWMNEVGFSSMTLGNHEYDWGAAVLTPNSKLAEFPFLAINVTQNGKPADYCRASVVAERGGLKVGIIGAIGDCLSSISGDFTDGLKFATGSELTNLVKNEAERLRSEEGCDFIVYSLHDGFGESGSATSVGSISQTELSSYYDLSLSDGYVDLVFEGHTHQSYMLRDGHGVYHLQGGGENSYVSRADLSYNTVTAEYTVTPRLLGRSVYADSSLEDDPLVEEIFNKYFPTDNPYTTVLGTNDVQRYGSDICDTVAKLYYSAGVELWGEDYDIVLGGGYLKTRSPYSVSAGGVTYAELFSVLPFDNDLVLGSIKGSDLKSKFLQTSNTNYHVYSAVSASEVLNSKNYYIIVDSYTSTYKSNNITEVARADNGKYARDLLADFVSAGGWGSSAKSVRGTLAEAYVKLTGDTL